MDSARPRTPTASAVEPKAGQEEWWLRITSEEVLQHWALILCAGPRAERFLLTGSGPDSHPVPPFDILGGAAVEGRAIMAEIIARISRDGGVELIDERSVKIEAVGSMVPFDAAYLARAMLASAAALCSEEHPPNAGELVDATQFPVMSWKVGRSVFTGAPVLVVRIPPGIELTFVLTPAAAIDIGTNLIAQGQAPIPPNNPTDRMH